MENQEQLKSEVKDLLNQLAIKLQNVEAPVVNRDDDDGSWNDLVSFQDSWGKDLKLASIKVVVNALLESVNSNERWTGRGAEKMARAYYTSFCNG